MTPESLCDGRVLMYGGDCMEVLAELPAESIDSVCCDPPYHLTSIVKRFGAENAAPAKAGKTGAYKRASAGFMGKQWDGGEIAFEPETWAAVYRVLKPGGHLCAFGAPKNFGFMQYAISQAGFEIRDVLCWLFGSGFPKSHDVSKGIDKAAGVRGADGRGFNAAGVGRSNGGDIFRSDHPDYVKPSGITNAAREWEGWGTALKPAYEPIILARKPLIGTVAENVLAHGTGALNIDGCRVGTAEDQDNARQNKGGAGVWNGTGDSGEGRNQSGRWPANVIHDGSDEVVGAFPETKTNPGQGPYSEQSTVNCFGKFENNGRLRENAGDSGSAARFFYTAKADQDDRLGSKHPTVKPLDLMQWLVRLVTPKGGLVLDPFAGTGTTGEAAFREGMCAILIEREAEYQNDIRRRMKLVLGGPDERKRESIKARGQTASAGPLFAEIWEEPFVDRS